MKVGLKNLNLFTLFKNDMEAYDSLSNDHKFKYFTKICFRWQALNLVSLKNIKNVL